MTEPRGITLQEAANYCGFSPSGFKEKLPALQATGFPKQDPILERFDRVAIDLWFDNRSQLKPSLAIDAQGLNERLARWEGSA